MVGLSINNRRKAATVVTLGKSRRPEKANSALYLPILVVPPFSSLPFTLRNGPNRKIPGSIDVLSTRIEGDPYLAAHCLPDEGKSAAE
jgi:hypothetical protein